MIPALAIGAAVWIVLCALAASLPGCAHVIGRFRARRRSDYTVLVLSLPPVPEPLARDDDEMPPWLFDQPSDPLTQDEFDLSEDILRGVA